MAREYIRQEQQGATLETLEKLTLGGLRRAVLEGDVETGSVMCGQVAGMLREVKPVAQILAEMVEGARCVMQETNGGWLNAL